MRHPKRSTPRSWSSSPRTINPTWASNLRESSPDAVRVTPATAVEPLPPVPQFHRGRSGKSHAGNPPRLRAIVLRAPIWISLVFVALYAVLYLQFAARLVSFPYDFDQGEGFDTWSAWLIHEGQLPYSANNAFPYYSSNYPPVWSAIVAVPLSTLG